LKQPLPRMERVTELAMELATEWVTVLAMGSMATR
jgi:hypothetical protein